MKDYFEDNPQSKRKVLEMFTVANEYCLFLEKAEEYPTEVLLDFLLKISPLLYLKGALLPAIITENEDKEERFVVEQQWEDLHNVLKDKFKENNVFHKLASPDTLSGDEMKGSIAENVADIYQDLKDFVMLYMKNTYTAKEAAVFQCYLLFRSHWGPLLLEIQPQLHQLLYDKELKQEE